MCSKFILTGVDTGGRRKGCNGHSVFDTQKVSVLPEYNTVLTKVWVREQGNCFLIHVFCSYCCFTRIAKERNSSSHEAYCKSRIVLWYHRFPGHSAL